MKIEIDDAILSAAVRDGVVAILTNSFRDAIARADRAEYSLRPGLFRLVDDAIEQSGLRQPIAAAVAEYLREHQEDVIELVRARAGADLSAAMLGAAQRLQSIVDATVRPAQGK